MVVLVQWWTNRTVSFDHICVFPKVLHTRFCFGNHWLNILVIWPAHFSKLQQNIYRYAMYYCPLQDFRICNLVLPHYPDNCVEVVMSCSTALANCPGPEVIKLFFMLN